MIILFEGHHYQTEVLESYGLDSYIYTSRDSDQSFIPYVGYFYSSKIDDAIFILPKVFLFEGENSKKESYGPSKIAFGKYCVEDVINITSEHNPLKKDGLDQSF